MEYQHSYDVIVIGGGHAGSEAAAAAARSGASVLLLTQNIETIGQMSCNPAIGGIGKSHLVREIDALDGLMARCADRSGIHFRMLNASKGPAVQAIRVQADRQLYKAAIRCMLEQQPNIYIFQQTVEDLIVRKDSICGVITQMGLRFKARTVVLTTGTFLGGHIHIGTHQYQGGRAGEAPANALAERLRALPLRVGRLKTGTPPRIAKNTIDFSKLAVQPSDTPQPIFSYMASRAEHPPQRECFIARTNEHTHEIIRAALHRSPIYNGTINSNGPRYCPSIEDKIVRFADKSSHQIFIEPEGLESGEIYPNGISTCLDFDVQTAMVRSVEGFEKAHITRPAYAIEYDYMDPRDLDASLETRAIEGLFFAGQINGTTGYEEAAAQGLIAGLNAARKAQDKALWYPTREQAYIGVLIDDLTVYGTDEPYRMFTSRAEYRLSLRQDNADLRLSEQGRALGLVGDERWRMFENKRKQIDAEQAKLNTLSVTPAQCRQLGIELKQASSAAELLKRPEVSYQDIVRIANIDTPATDEQVVSQIEIQAKYSGYLARQKDEIDRLAAARAQRIPPNFDYSEVVGLSNELRDKLNEAKPASIGQAERIQGMTPASLSLLRIYLKKHEVCYRRSA
ncbi:MAG: tRNA uridine-5-carboxymethylaminomethyl(34) synthesis enzyme MnmG [Gammaproteobacteria bacterium]|nr:tRNA uridine-5-carboxymethylaminomethyl(34) synthesis enzyme MnmG [Gammaproteobacteria bacterium]